MIDFKNGAVFKLKKVDGAPAEVQPLLIANENIIGSYKTIRDSVVFTDKRIIAINVQGFTGTKKDFTTLPYSKVQAFSVETAGLFDMDNELELYFSALGRVKFDFTGQSDIIQIGQVISQHVL